MNDHPWTIGLTGLLGIIFGAVVTGAFNLLTKRNDYVNDYYKLVINRRVEAYQVLESLIVNLKLSVLDNDNRPYHFVLGGEGGHMKLYELLVPVLSQSLWISDEAFDKTQELNYLIFKLGADSEKAIAFGKDNYTIIANIRSNLENILANDMMNIHDVARFLHKKGSKKSEFREISLR